MSILLYLNYKMKTFSSEFTLEKINFLVHVLKASALRLVLCHKKREIESPERAQSLSTFLIVVQLKTKGNKWKSSF